MFATLKPEQPRAGTDGSSVAGCCLKGWAEEDRDPWSGTDFRKIEYHLVFSIIQMILKYHLNHFSTLNDESKCTGSGDQLTLSKNGDKIEYFGLFWQQQRWRLKERTRKNILCASRLQISVVIYKNFRKSSFSNKKKHSFILHDSLPAADFTCTGVGSVWTVQCLKNS